MYVVVFIHTCRSFYCLLSLSLSCHIYIDSMSPFAPSLYIRPFSPFRLTPSTKMDQGPPPLKRINFFPFLSLSC